MNAVVSWKTLMLIFFCIYCYIFYTSDASEYHTLIGVKLQQKISPLLGVINTPIHYYNANTPGSIYISVSLHTNLTLCAQTTTGRDQETCYKLQPSFRIRFLEDANQILIPRRRQVDIRNSLRSIHLCLGVRF